MPRCIYCLVDKPLSDFNREHVLPDAFGRFSNAPVLHDAVCEECNSYFGGTLDLTLGRSSSEGLERYGWHVKPSHEVDRFRYGDVLIRYDASGTEWDKALVRKIPGPNPGETLIELIPQAVFESKDDSGPIHVPEWEIRSGKWRTDNRLDLTRGIRILALTTEYDQVKAALQEQGIAWKEEHQAAAPPSGPGEVATVQHEFRVTGELRRAIAKLGLNYFTFRTGRELALHPRFDEVREYIRYGTMASFRPVTLTKSLVTASGEDELIPVVHCLTLREDDYGCAFAHVTLFNWAVYKVLLSPTRLDFDIGPASGHLYNIADLTCYSLSAKTQ